MNQHPLIDFFFFDGKDNRGRSLAQILKQSDAWLERTHDYIQWLFPLKNKSGANPGAPLVDARLSIAFERYEMGSSQMLQAFDRMLAFYGLERDAMNIEKGPNWVDRKENWFTHPTHNDLRITRIINSMSILGMNSYAQIFLNALLTLPDEPDCGFCNEAIEYWKSAIQKPPSIATKSKTITREQSKIILHNVVESSETSVQPAVLKLIRFEEMYQSELAEVSNYFAQHHLPIKS